MMKASARWAVLLVVSVSIGCAWFQKSETGKAKEAAPPVVSGKPVTNPEKETFPVFLRKAPVMVDGDLSDWPSGLPVGKVASPDGTHEVVFRVFVTATRVYAAFEVADPTPTVNRATMGETYNGDALEIFFGTHDESRSSLRPGDVQVLIAYNPKAPHAWNNFSNAPMKDALVVEKDVRGGWVVEASFTHAELGISPPAPGQPVWLEVALDNANGGARAAQWVWLGNLDMWKTPSMWKKTAFAAAP